MLVMIDDELKEVTNQELYKMIKNDINLDKEEEDEKVDQPKILKAVALFRLTDDSKSDKSEYTEINLDGCTSIYLRAVVIDMVITSLEEREMYLSDALDKAYELSYQDEESLINTIPYNLDNNE